MGLRRTPILIHLLGAAAASALVAFWALQLIAPATPAAPAATTATLFREPDAGLAARMFGDVGARTASTMNVQVSGVFAAGRSSSAVISMDGKPARAVLLGQELAEGVRLTEVRADGVVLERDGTRMQFIVPPAAVAKASAQAAVFRREGATLTAPSVELPVAGKSVAGVPQNPVANVPPPGTGPSRNVPAESMLPRRGGAMPPPAGPAGTGGAS